jgi:hypothetical protein
VLAASLAHCDELRLWAVEHGVTLHDHPDDLAALDGVLDALHAEPATEAILASQPTMISRREAPFTTTGRRQPQCLAVSISIGAGMTAVVGPGWRLGAAGFRG